MLTCLFFLLTSWITELVTTGPVGLLPGVIALDSVGNPYILVPRKRNGTTPPLYYLFLYSKNGGTWTADTFELNNAGLPTGRWDLTIDRYDCFWCVYSIYNEIDSTLHLMVARKDSLGWIKDTVSTEGACYSQSIATDTIGVPHIAYDDMINGWSRGFYAYLDDTIWQKTLIDSNILAYYCSIDLDSHNSPHISYFHHSFDSSTGIIYEILSHAYTIDSVWFLEQIDSSAWYVSWSPTSICVASDGLPGIAYIYPATYQVKYAWYDGAVWHIDTVDVSGGFETQKSLDMDSLSKPHFIYTSGSNSYLAYKTTSGWHKELLSLTPTVTKGFGGSLRIARDGIIHIARFATNDDYTYREIHYIYGTPEGIEEETKGQIPKAKKIKLAISPNLITHNAQLQYTIPEKQRVKIVLYDITGSKISVIVEGIVVPGVYSYNLNACQLNQGIYFLVLEGIREIITKKILIVK
jgi:hypothetical protein